MKVCEHIYQIRIDFQVTEKIKRYVFVYLITGTYCYLIDSGVAGCEEIIGKYMNSLGRTLSEVKAIFLTHAHPDHIGGAAAIKKISNCKIYASRKEKDWIEDIALQFKERPIPNFYTLVQEGVEVDKLAGEGDKILLEPGMTMRVLETAGHSRGSVSYVLEEPQVLFSGDAIPMQNDFPIFVDEAASELALAKIQEQQNIRFYCPAWDRIYKMEEISQVINNRMELLKSLKKCVKMVEQDYPQETEEKKQEYIEAYMGWQHIGRNPLFHTSVTACKE